MTNTNAAICSTKERIPFAHLRATRVVRRINAWMASPYYVMLIGLLAAVSNLFSAELAVYTFYILCGLYISFLGDDFLPVMPIVICCYIAPSAVNNPGVNENSVFYPENGGIYLFAIAALFVASVVWRLAADPQQGGKKFFTTPRALLGGMLFLGCAFMLGGVGSGAYFERGLNNALFALLQFASVFLMYYLFTGGVRWENARRDYFAWIGLSVGSAILLQIGNIYCVGGVIVDGIIDREAIVTGWGMYNNIGAMLACMIPCAYYLACRRKYGWVYNLCGLAFLAGVLFTCSRSSILGAVAAYVVSYILVLIKAKNKRANNIAHLVTIAVILAVVGFFHKEIYQLFRGLADKGLDSNSRDVLYAKGFEQFLRFPIFGGTFYPVDFHPWDMPWLDSFTSFYPLLWHNTIVQIGASCGVVGLLAYGYHRYQTVKLLATKVSLEKIYIAVSLAALLATSLLDCHMFHGGPVLYYSMMLAFAEKCAVGIKMSMQ